RPDRSGVLSVARVLSRGLKSKADSAWFRHDAAAGHDNGASAAEGHRLIGADPEFLLFAPDGRLVFADAFLPKRGPAGCDAAYIDGRRMYPLAEVRPIPASEPLDLLRNTYRALRAASLRIADPRLRWLAGGWPACGYPIGGHLHF